MKNIIKYLTFGASLLCAAGLCSCEDDTSGESHFIYFGVDEPYTRIGSVEFTIDLYKGLVYNPEPLPSGTDLTAVKIWFVTNHDGKGVFVNGVKQQSGVTANDFTGPVEYEIRTENEVLRYTATINVSATCNTQAGIKLESNGLVASIDNDESSWLSPAVKVSKVEFTTATDPARSLRLCLFEADLSDPSVAIRTTLPSNGDGWGLQNMVDQARATNDAGFYVLGAINGDAFEDGGDNAGMPEGIVCRDGTYLKDNFNDEANGSFFGIRNDGRAALGSYGEFLVVKERLYNGIGAGHKLIIDGGALAQTDTGIANRTAAGMNTSDLKTLFLMVVEGIGGADPDDPKGVTLAELASLMGTLGAGHAVGFDGGDSSTFVVRGGDGTFTALNRPGGTLRSVADGLAIILK